MIYLDSAATTLEKPASVSRAVVWAMHDCASPGRGGYPAGMRAGELLYRCRETAARLFDVPDPEQVVLTGNATHGLNIAIRSLVGPGATVLISGYEHNAVTRVLHGIPDVKIRVVNSALFDPEAAYIGFEQTMTDDVDVVICNHVSNVFGFVLPVERIAALCAARRKPLIIDASQSAGTLPVSLKDWGAAFIAMPGHKGLYGPQGTGLLLCGMEPKPLLYGGTGSASIQQEMPDFLPDRLEAGTQNVCGAAGLLAGMEFVEKTGIGQISRHERQLCRLMMKRLEKMPAVHVFKGEAQGGLFSFVIDGKDCENVGETLGRWGVAVRTGLHCAPLAHKTAGTLERGTVRVSFSAFNRQNQVEQATQLIKKIAAGGSAR